MKIQLSPYCENETNETEAQDQFYVETASEFKSIIISIVQTFFILVVKIIPKLIEVSQKNFWDNSTVNLTENSHFIQPSPLLIEKFVAEKNSGQCKFIAKLIIRFIPGEFRALKTPFFVFILQYCRVST